MTSSKCLNITIQVSHKGLYTRMVRLAPRFLGRLNPEWFTGNQMISQWRISFACKAQAAQAPMSAGCIIIMFLLLVLLSDIIVVVAAVVIPPAFMTTGYIVFVFPFVRSYNVCSFVSSFVSYILRQSFG